MGVVLDQRDFRPVDQRSPDPGHVARNAGIVDGHHGPDPVVEQRLQMRRVEPQRLRLDIAEEQLSPLTHEGERRRGEREGRYDDGVARVEVKQHGRELERSGARRGEQDLLGAGRFLEHRPGEAAEHA
jgi:hypothetical protein